MSREREYEEYLRKVEALCESEGFLHLDLNCYYYDLRIAFLEQVPAGQIFAELFLGEG